MTGIRARAAGRSSAPVSFTSTTVGQDWEHGLVAGNGRLGLMIFGAPGRHQVTLSHERVVLPADPLRSAPVLAPDLDTFRDLIVGGQAQAAADLAVERSAEQGYPGLQWTDPIVPVASLTWDDPAAIPPDASDYRREVDLDTGLLTLSWTAGASPTRIRAFVSRADDVAVVEVRGSGAVRPRLEPPVNVATTDAGVRGGNESRAHFTRGDDDPEADLRLTFTPPWPAAPTGARTRITRLDPGPQTVLLLLSVVPEPAGPHRTVESEPSFEELLERHRRALAREVATSTLALDVAPSGRSTEQLMSSSDPPHRAELVMLLHRSGQSLITASTGEFPPTLQGIWSGSFDPAWSSDFTMNGNVQNGSIAAMLGTGNPAQLRTYLDMLSGFGADFADNSRRLFGTEGYVLPSRCSIRHGRTTHFDARHCHEFWTAGGAWAAAFFLDHCWYTGDLQHLGTQAYPFAREVERFYEGFLQTEAGVLVFNPSYSPENTSPTFGSQACRNATQDRAALAVLLRGLRRAARLLGLDADLDARRVDWLARLPPYRVAPDGTLAEWLDDDVIERLGHRTASHLLELWFEPGPEFDDPRLRSAVAETVRRKLDWRAGPEGTEEMGYGLVQLGLAAATIGRSDLALECVDRMAGTYFLPSLVPTHDGGSIFNVDIAGGLPAVVNAMLVRSTPDRLDLVPALPESWPSGSVHGLHARGALVVEQLTWDTDVVEVAVRAGSGAGRLRRGRPLKVTAGPEGAEQVVELADGETYCATLRRGRPV